jgi:hypothetical protein
MTRSCMRRVDCFLSSFTLLLLKRLSFFAWLVPALLLPALACTGLVAEPPIADVQVGPAEPYPPAGAGGATASLPESTAPAAVQEPADAPSYSIDRITDSLAALATYRMEVRLRYTAAHSGTDQWLTAETVYVAQPPASGVTLHFGNVGQDEAVDSVSLVQLGDYSFAAAPGFGCLSEPGGAALAEHPFAELTTPDTFVRGLTGARRLLPDEVIRGTPVRHYTFDQHSLGQPPGQITSLEGHVYVAEPGGYVVRLTLVAHGREWAALGQKEEGRLILEVDVLDLNQPLVVVPPAECGQAVEAPYPVLPDATARLVLPDLFSYRSRYSLVEAVDFYRQEMPATGWTAVGEELVLAHVAILYFRKDSASATVTVSYESAGDLIAVLILQEP